MAVIEVRDLVPAENAEPLGIRRRARGHLSVVLCHLSFFIYRKSADTRLLIGAGVGASALGEVSCSSSTARVAGLYSWGAQGQFRR